MYQQDWQRDWLSRVLFDNYLIYLFLVQALYAGFLLGWPS